MMVGDFRRNDWPRGAEKLRKERARPELFGDKLPVLIALWRMYRE
jgi:hypothetical protein